MSQKTNPTEMMNEYTTTATEALKTLAAWQWKAGQTLFDHSLRTTQTWYDLSQESYKASLATGEMLRKEWTTLAEKFATPSK